MKRFLTEDFTLNQCSLDDGKKKSEEEGSEKKKCHSFIDALMKKGFLFTLCHIKDEM